MAAEAGAGAKSGRLDLGRSRTAALRFIRGQGIKRMGWGVADQAVSSLTNFAVALYVARELGATQFGAFSLAYVTYSFALNASRGLATDPLMVRFSGKDTATWRRAIGGCTGTALIVGLITALGVLAVVPFLGGTSADAFLALGLTLPGLLLQDSWRYAFFAHGKGSQAFLNDVVWAVLLFPALYLLSKTGHQTVFWFVLAWGASACAAAVLGPLQARVIPRPERAWRWLREHRDLGFRYFAENSASSVSGQLRVYGITAIAGLATVGVVQASSTLMGPFMVIFYGMSLVLVPEAARVLERNPQHLRRFCVLVSVGLTVLAVGWGLVLLVGLPRGLGNLLLGQLWHKTYPLVIPQTIFIVGACVSGGVAAGLHALGAAKRSLKAMVLLSVVYTGGALVGVAVDGAAGSVIGAAVGAWIGALLWWWQLHRALHEAGHLRRGRHRQAPASVRR